MSYCQSCADLEAMLSAAQANLLGSLGPDGKKRLEARCAALTEALEKLLNPLVFGAVARGPADGRVMAEYRKEDWEHARAALAAAREAAK